MCYRPITIKDPSTGRYIKVPCGKCLDCLKKYQNEFSNRMYEEFKAKGFKGVFFTLTYDDNHVPKNYLADGYVFRSTSDYGYSNLHKIDGKWCACEYDFKTRKYTPCRAHKKRRESPYQVLTDLGIPTSDIQDFNRTGARRTARQNWLKEMKSLFVDSFPGMDAFSVEPEAGTICEIDPHDYLTTDFADIPLTDESFWLIDKETGEVSFRKHPEEKLYDYEKLRAWYRKNTPVISFNSVRIEDVQSWLHRCKERSRRSNPQFDCSYFITSEYGPRTLRPHYHGVLFGVSKDDVEVWFRDWKRHYGERVEFDNLDPTKGGLSYVSKYCSKGTFEHPLCSKDFFYYYRRAQDFEQVICNEYHSKSYEKCLEYFGMDVPIVDKTFHLVSKGLGIEYTKKNNLRCEEFEDIVCNYVAPFRQDSIISYSFVSNLGVTADALLSGDFDMQSIIDKAIKYEKEHSPESWLKDFVRRGRYFRNCRVKDKETGNIKEMVLGFSLPRYYRAKLFGPNLRHSYPHFVRSEYERLYQEKLESVATTHPSGEDIEVVLELERIERQEIVDRFNKAFESQKRFLEKSKL